MEVIRPPDVRAVVQRVDWAKVSVDAKVVGRCGKGLLVLLAAHRDDTEAAAAKMADRVAKLRIFGDAGGKMNLALGDLDPAGEVLAISNFTLYGETAKNRRPSFIESAPYEQGEALFGAFVEALKKMGVATQSGVFGAHMDVELHNDGPVTLILDVP